MSAFVGLANLPKETSMVIIGEKYAEILRKSLNNLGISTTFIPDNPYVDVRLSGHADLSVFHAGGERIYLASHLKGTNFEKEWHRLGADLVFLDMKQSATYPHDAQFNACTVGRRLIYAPKVTGKEIVDYFTNEQGTDLLPIRQGYGKCSVCVVDERSIITADKGIAEAAKKIGLDVLQITPGFIDLPGFAYGFIGGSVFRISEHIMAFTGLLDGHPDKAAILSFIGARGFEPVYLTENKIFDIGSALPILEKQSRK